MSTSLKFDDASKVGVSAVDGTVGATDAAPFDPENPESTVTAPVLPDDASVIQRATYYFALARYHKDRKLATLRPWKEFGDRAEFSIPGKLEALSRISDNVQYFNSNYAVLVSVMSLYILITNLWFMVGMSLCGACYYWVKLKVAAKEPIQIGSTVMTATQSYFALLIFSLFTFYITDGSSTVFWLVTSAGAIVLGHATCRKTIASSGNSNPAFSFA